MTDASKILNDVRKQRRELDLQPLLKREFQVAEGVDTEISSMPNPALRVMQWNLLAQALSQGDDNFVLCPESALDWNHRKLHITEELLTYSPSIICLEEVDHFSYLEEILTSIGYSGVFFPKPDSPCLYCRDSNGPDGCAVFWKASELHLISQTNVVLRNDKNCKTNQVAILCKFLTKGSQKELIVAVTHLKSKTPYWNLRHQQGKYLEKVLYQAAGTLPVILCGDFNAEPSEQVYSTFKNSLLELGSAYCHLKVTLDEPAYTTWKIRGSTKNCKELSEVAHCIDYVWYSRSHLQPVALLKFPSEDEIGKDRLPSFTYPSDHLSLVVDFIFRN